jgi:hypothetical protein
MNRFIIAGAFVALMGSSSLAQVQQTYSECRQTASGLHWHVVSYALYADPAPNGRREQLSAVDTGQPCTAENYEQSRWYASKWDETWPALGEHPPAQPTRSTAMPGIDDGPPPLDLDPAPQERIPSVLDDIAPLEDLLRPRRNIVIGSGRPHIARPDAGNGSHTVNGNRPAGNIVGEDRAKRRLAPNRVERAGQTQRGVMRSNARRELAASRIAAPRVKGMNRRGLGDIRGFGRMRGTGGMRGMRAFGGMRGMGGMRGFGRR